MTSIGNRIVAASFALKPLGLSLLVSTVDFKITADPDDPEKTVAVCQSIEEVEAFIADHRPTATARQIEAANAYMGATYGTPGAAAAMAAAYAPLKPIEQRPHVSLPVHYVSHGSPVRADGTQAYTSQCRAAIVTEVYDTDPVPEHGVPYVGLCVLNPTGQFFIQGVRYDPGTFSGERTAATGEPMPLVTCADLTFEGGTWHWISA